MSRSWKILLHQDLSQHTVRAFDSDLPLLTSFVGPRTPIGHIGSERLEAFLTYLRYERGVPCKLKSLARRLTTLKVFFSWLAREGAIDVLRKGKPLTGGSENKYAFVVPVRFHCSQ